MIFKLKCVKIQWVIFFLNAQKNALICKFELSTCFKYVKKFMFAAVIDRTEITQYILPKQCYEKKQNNIMHKYRICILTNKNITHGYN